MLALVVTALSLGTHDDLGTVYFMAVRLFLILPTAIWFVTLCLEPLPLVKRWQQFFAVALLALIAVTAGYR